MNSRDTLRWMTCSLLGLVVPCCGPATQDPTPPDATFDDAAAPHATSTWIDPAGANAAAISPPLLVAPRPVAPLSGSTVGTARPLLRWALPAGLVPSRLHVDVCADRSCTRVEWSSDASGEAAMVERDLAAGVHFWRVQVQGAPGERVVSSPTWNFRAARGSMADGAQDVWGTTPDYDGDGAPDVAAAGWVFRDAQHGGPEGRMLVFGNANGALSVIPDRSLVTQPPLRGPLVALGDVNGDGRCDLAQSDPDARGGDGELVVRVGRAHGIWLSDPEVTGIHGGAGEHFGRALAAAGDANRDGYADAVASAGASFVELLGSATGLHVGMRHERPAVLGERFVVRGVFSAGDANGDGFGDVAVSYADPAQDYSRVFLYWGGADGFSREGRDLGSYGGYPGVAAADEDGDGFADVAIAQTSAPTGGGARLTVFRGGRDAHALQPGTAVLLRGRGPERANLVSGDFDGDGYGDFAVFHHGDDDVADTAGGRVVLSVVLGGPTGARLGQVLWFQRSGTAPTDAPDGSGSPETNAGIGGENFLPEFVFGLGDGDGDGYADVALEGRASDGFVIQIYRGSPAGLRPEPAATLRWPDNAPGPDNLTLTRFAGTS